MILICGLGKTGISFLKHLNRLGLKGAAFDTRDELANLSEIQTQCPNVSLFLGTIPDEVLDEVSEIWVSPGVDLSSVGRISVDVIRQKGEVSVYANAGLRCAKPAYMDLVPVSDIQLFANSAKAPIIAITGTNGKSTVTTMVHQMINAAGKKALIGGNIGVPALDLLDEPVPDYYVLELSSFQLEHTPLLNAHVACILNITPDHLDRHGSMENYIRAKENIFNGCEYAVGCHPDDVPTQDRHPDDAKHPSGPIRLSSINMMDTDARLRLYQHDGLRQHDDSIKPNIKTLNEQSALAITKPLNLPLEPQFKALANFKGLPHRLQVVGTINGVTYINDSKATNVGATIAALESVGRDHKGKIILLLGGVGKGQDFSALQNPIQTYCKAVIVYGESAYNLETQLEVGPILAISSDMSGALELADQCVAPGDVVLLAPACASYNEFANFEERGKVFGDLINAMAADSCP